MAEEKKIPKENHCRVEYHCDCPGGRADLCTFGVPQDGTAICKCWVYGHCQNPEACKDEFSDSNF